jgi:hypothetical protein
MVFQPISAPTHLLETPSAQPRMQAPNVSIGTVPEFLELCCRKSQVFLNFLTFKGAKPKYRGNNNNDHHQSGTTTVEMIPTFGDGKFACRTAVEWATGPYCSQNRKRFFSKRCIYIIKAALQLFAAFGPCRCISLFEP